jgi:phospholipid/cholesterol/gamma-HCH transport system substrate-binding protein
MPIGGSPGWEESRQGMQSVSVAGRIAATAAVVVAIVVIAVLLFAGGSGGHTIKADFINAAQLVKGNLVEIGGDKVGTVDSIDITQDGQAQVTMSIDDAFWPLRRGTRATVRQASLSGIANRYVDLTLPSGNTTKSNQYQDGGVIPISDTTTAVDLDQLFNIFNPSTRKSVTDFLHNSAAQFQGKTAQQRAAYHFLNPALSTSSRLFNELNRDTPLLVRFLNDSANLVTDVAQRKNDLAALIGNANQTFRAIAIQKGALADAIGQLPDFMRRANTTFANLRSTLDQVDPLVNASKPVAIKLQPLLANLRPLARDAKPTVRDLSNIIRKPGADNDLTELTQTFPALASAALDKKDRKIDMGTGPVDVGTTDGSFPQTEKALDASTPIIAEGRPYTTDLFSWFDGFSTTGTYDANGGFARALGVFNASTFTGSVPTLLPLGERGINHAANLRIGQYRRCPGASEAPAADGSNVWSPQDQQQLACRDSDRAVGNVK